MRADGWRATVGLACALGVLFGGCVTRRTTALSPGVSTPSTATAMEGVVRAALLADASGDPAADTLYAPGATVVANGRERIRLPRLAGVGYGGRITVTAAAATMEGRYGWATLDYRWINVDANNVAAGRATVVCRLVEGRWKIVHLHSSQPLPWDR